MTYRLIIHATQGGAGERELDLDRDVVLAGKRPGVDVLLPHPDVGGVHFRLEREGDAMFIVDAGTASGTRVDAGAALPAGERHPIHDGATIRVGELYSLTYRARSPAAAATSPEGTNELARAMVRDVLGALGRAAPDAQPRLELAGAAPRRLELPAPGRDLIIGRGESCDAMLVDPDLSREHVRIHRTWSGATIAELGSKNGSQVNGEPLATGVERTLRHGDRITMGQSVLEYRDPADEYLASLATSAAVVVPAAVPAPRPRVIVYVVAGGVVVAALVALAFLLFQT